MKALSTIRNSSKAGQNLGYGLLTRQMLAQQNERFNNTGGISQNNRTHGFLPAFYDEQTGSIYLSRFADGRPAPMHLLDGLPPAVVMQRSATGRVVKVKKSVIAGFVRFGRFHTREQAAEVVG